MLTAVLLLVMWVALAFIVSPILFWAFNAAGYAAYHKNGKQKRYVVVGMILSVMIAGTLFVLSVSFGIIQLVQVIQLAFP